MYQGPSLERKNTAVLFVQSRLNSKYRTIDGLPVNFIYDGRVLEFAPGKHIFEVELSTYQTFGYPMVSSTRNFLIGTYELQLDMQQGYTYALDFYTINAENLPSTLCFFGEPHDAPGSSVNLSGELRRMSPSAEKFACTAVKHIRRSTK